MYLLSYFVVHIEANSGRVYSNKKVSTSLEHFLLSGVGFMLKSENNNIELDYKQIIYVYTD